MQLLQATENVTSEVGDFSIVQVRFFVCVYLFPLHSYSAALGGVHWHTLTQFNPENWHHSYMGVRLLSQGGNRKLVRKCGCHSYIFTSQTTSQILKTGVTHQRVGTLDSKRKKKTCQKMWVSLVHVFTSHCVGQFLCQFHAIFETNSRSCVFSLWRRWWSHLGCVRRCWTRL